MSVTKSVDLRHFFELVPRNILFAYIRVSATTPLNLQWIT